jgi:hypothetical protein
MSAFTPPEDRNAWPSQPLPNIASLITVDEWKPVISLGGGVKFKLYKNMILRGDFRDYLTTFPRRQIVPHAFIPRLKLDASSSSQKAGE